jgi:hypothetical protein
VLQQGEESARVSSDRVTPAPAPHGTTTIPNRLGEDESAPREKDAIGEAGIPEEEEQYDFEKISGVRQMADGTLRY